MLKIIHRWLYHDLIRYSESFEYMLVVGAAGVEEHDKVQLVMASIKRGELT